MNRLRKYKNKVFRRKDMRSENNKKLDRNMDICKIHYKRKGIGYGIILLALIVLNMSTGFVSATATTAPSSITNINIRSYSTNYINWAWTDPSTTDFSYVKVYFDGKFATNVQKGIQHFGGYGLLPNTLHKISTHTVDKYGNINKAWVNSSTRTASSNTNPGGNTNPSMSSFKFIAWGDTKGGTNILQAESKSIASRNLNPSFTLYVGDICDSGPSAACFATHKSAFNGDSTGATSNGIFDKTFAVRGNHDSSGGSVWQSGFNFKNVASNIGAKNYVEQKADMTYSFDYGNSHFVGLDDACGSQNACASDITSSQINWLDQDLTNAESRGLKHAFLFWHGPAYTVSAHCCGGVLSAMIAVLNKHPIVSAGFFGHEHLLEYTHLDSSVMPSLKYSLEQVITGGAGAGLYSPKSGRSMNYYMGNSYGYVMVNVYGNNFDISFYKADGTSMKTLTCTGTGACK
jgi:hypothetical protein